MSERPNDKPADDDLAPIDADDGAGAAADEAPDLEGEDAEATADELADDELDDEPDDEPTIEVGDAALQAAAAEEAKPEVAVGGATIAVEAQTRPMRPSERRAMRAAMDHGQLTIDPAHRVSDRASAVFVLVTAAAFLVILLYGLGLGHGGFLTPIPTPSAVPSVTASPVPGASVDPSGSPAASPTPTLAPTATPEVTSPPPSETPGPS
jgi:hypothetical protein